MTNLYFIAKYTTAIQLILNHGKVSGHGVCPGKGSLTLLLAGLVSYTHIVRLVVAMLISPLAVTENCMKCDNTMSK